MPVVCWSALRTSIIHSKSLGLSVANETYSLATWMSAGDAEMEQNYSNENYQANRVFMFDSKLAFSEGIKCQIASLLDYPFEQQTTFAASVSPSTLIAENKVKIDGSRYILIRKATGSEKRDLFDSGDNHLDEEIECGGESDVSAVPNKPLSDLSDEDVHTLTLEVMCRAADIQEAVEAAFYRQGPSSEQAIESWWSVFGGRFRAAAGELPLRPIERTDINLAAERAQEKAESNFRTYCFLVMGVKHGIEVEEIPQMAMLLWWKVFGIRAESLLNTRV